MKIYLFDNDPQPEVFAAGQPVFRAGDKGDCMFAVTKGAVDIVIAGKTVETVEGGGIFGEMALVDRAARAADGAVNAEAMHRWLGFPNRRSPLE
jgi:CRP-like cAMP-binding protein